MNLKEVLLNGLSFNEILKRFSIDRTNFTIRDEEVIECKKNLTRGDIFKESIVIQGKADNGPIFNFFGTLHYNLLNHLAVFELDSVEKNAVSA
ncbi:hypothetical protein [Hufsiella ginkgonis]|uniref:Uncharacterized protein n=1 Tax=Hufsiella ginkgonis TaxID=2695274 RepID=A0A7K1Y0U7_9SPHI|nr:hypothetical protein [Hufsiella ginkgonis]MXV16296.1 hypothetical protein [Hufsiella ginkgonis]